MRIITPTADTELQKRFGAEPLIVVGISFGGNFVYFGDRDHTDFEGRVLEVADLDNVINISKNATVSNILIKFLDTDGYFKQLFNTVDFHKQPLRVYQYFPGTIFATDRILLFDGYMSTPIEYHEGEMTLSVTGVSKLEDIEIGFSTDNAIWRHIIPNALEAEAWPMPFGMAVNYKIPQITKTAYGTLVHGFGIHDFTLQYQINALRTQINQALDVLHGIIMLELYCAFVADRCKYEAESLILGEETPETNELISQLTSQANYYYSLANQYHAEQFSLSDRINEMRTESANHTATLAQQLAYEPGAEGSRNISIWNGKTFPQGEEIWLNIGGALVKGHFKDEGEDPIKDAGKVDTFYVSAVVHPKTCCYFDKHCPELGCEDDDVLVPTVIYGVYSANNLADESVRMDWDYRRMQYWATTSENIPTEPPNLMELPPDLNAETRTQNLENQITITPNGYGGITVTRNGEVWKPGSLFTSSMASTRTDGRIKGDPAGFSWIPTGSRVRLAYNDPVDMIVSIVPGTLVKVSAYRTYGGERVLATVPSTWYTTEWRDYGDGLNALVLTIAKPLSTVAESNFEDDIYVTFESDIGPNIVDVIEYIIEKYLPQATCDLTTFAQAWLDSDYYPCNFVILTRKNVIDVLSEMCYQACLGIWYSEGDVFLRYLPNQPTAVAELTEASIDTGTLVLSYTNTDDIVTKMVASYVTSYEQEEPFVIAARYNVAKYGTIEEEIDYYIYTDRDAVLHSVTFWLLRKGNIWKYIKCTTPLHTLVLETMDPVTVNLLAGFVSNTAVIGCVEECRYDSVTFSITYGVWIPVRAGEMDLFSFAYYNIGDVYEYFPTPIDWVSGNGIGSPIIRDFVDGAVSDGADSPYGPYNPSERQVQYVPVKSQPKLYGGTISQTHADGNPKYPGLDPGWGSDTDPGEGDYEYGDGAFTVEDPEAWEEEGAQTKISLHGTKIWDSQTQKYATLATFFASCDHNAAVAGGTVPVLNVHPKMGVITVGDEAAAGSFSLKYDSDTKSYAARLAFLKSEQENYIESGGYTPPAQSGVASGTGASYG